MASRSPDKASSAISSIQATLPSSSCTGRITFLQMDLTSLPSVCDAARRFLSLESSLHGLVNNAGVMAIPYSLTRDGHEIQWQTNYLSHWLFTHLLLPLMLETARREPTRGSVRIVNLSSSGHTFSPKGGINFDDTALEQEKGWTGPWLRYGQSKLANVLHAGALHRMYGPGSPAFSSSASSSHSERHLRDYLSPGSSATEQQQGGSSVAQPGRGQTGGVQAEGQGQTQILARGKAAPQGQPSGQGLEGQGGESAGEIWTTSIHPGLVYTNLISANLFLRLLFSALTRIGLMWPADRGSWNSLFCVASQDMTAEMSGQYLDIYHRFGEPSSSSAYAQDRDLGDRLERWTRDLMRRDGWIE